MRTIMAEFLGSQLDFIAFFYGLAFLLLGGVCFAITGARERRALSRILGCFAIAHGVNEWLELFALLTGDSTAFALARTGLMALSFLLLLEYARRELIQLGVRVPSPWLYGLLAVPFCVSAWSGAPNSANAVARYSLGLPGALATAWAMALRARGVSRALQRPTILAAVGFALYALCAGVIVPAAPFWPASVINYAWFARVAGVPIQLVRALLACWIALSLWLLWKRMVAEDVASERYSASQHKIVAWSFVSVALVLALGWALTEYLGDIYSRNLQQQSAADVRLFTSRLDRETGILDHVVRALARSPLAQSLLADRPRRASAALPGSAPDPGQSALDLALAASGARAIYVLDGARAVVASSIAQHAAAPGAPPEASLADAGTPVGADGDAYFAVQAGTHSLDYHTRYPVRSPTGAIAGTVVLIKSLDAIGSDLGGFHRSYFLLDPDGAVLLTNRPELTPHGGWRDSSWISFDGRRQYVRRQFINQGRWSLVLLVPDPAISASRFLGIVITLLVSVVLMLFFYERERSIRDQVDMERRLNLRAVARDLRIKATTDALTGVYNRLRFNEALALEVARSRRYRTPLSLVLFDIDHFKAVNDTHGHQVGDAVLIQLCEFTARRIRPSDLLARWGGEEFVILAPGSDGHMACLAAERLRTELHQLLFEQVGNLSCSFGVAQYQAGESAESFIARADAALYRAKLGGRNRVVLA